MRKAALIALLVAGCAVTTPRTHFYTLSAEAAAQSEAKGPVVSIWQVAIPEVADRTQMVVRVEPNKVDIADFHRWAEPLRRGVPRVLAENLQRHLPNHLVVAGQPAGLSPEVRVAIDLQKFDAVLGQGVTVDALWTIRRAKDLRTGRSSVTESAAGRDHAAIAAAYSRALDKVSQELAAAIGAP
jgi:uncharacterized lipoprotein YmbA